MSRHAPLLVLAAEKYHVVGEAIDRGKMTVSQLLILSHLLGGIVLLVDEWEEQNEVRGDWGGTLAEFLGEHYYTDDELAAFRAEIEAMRMTPVICRMAEGQGLPVEEIVTAKVEPGDFAGLPVIMEDNSE